MCELVGRLERQEGFDEVVAGLKAGHAATLDGVWGSSCALVAAALAAHGLAPMVIVCPRATTRTTSPTTSSSSRPWSPSDFPPGNRSPGDRVIHDEIFGDRVRLLKLLGRRTARSLVVASIQSLIQPVPEPALLESQTRTLEVGEQIEIQALARWLVENGYHNTTAVELPGEFSVRGGIVDIFAPDWYDPVRVEFFGDQIESIRQFEVATPAEPGEAGGDAS